MITILLFFLDVIFTSGGTESNNLAIHSAVEYYSSSRDFGRLPHVVTTNLEHDSVALCVQALKQKGCIGMEFVRARSLVKCACRFVRCFGFTRGWNSAR